MLYAKVCVGLPVEGPFDYRFPEELVSSLKPGCRVWVVFGTRRICGYVVGLSRRSSITGVKPVLGVIDAEPVLDSGMLEATRRLSGYFCCSWGQMIESSLPEALRQGRKRAVSAAAKQPDPDGAVPDRLKAGAVTVVSDPGGAARWEFYAAKAAACVSAGRSVIAVFSDKKRAAQAYGLLSGKGLPGAELVFRKKPHETDEWERIRQAGVSVVCGTRSSVFAPCRNPGLIIVDEEEDPVHKQEQAPHYHPREAALIRAEAQGAEVVLCSSVPSLEAYRLCQEKKASWLDLAPESPPAALETVDMKDIPVLDRKQGLVISQTLRDGIRDCLERKEKVLLFLNRRGFATYAYCRTCRKVIRCQRCSTALTFYFSENLLRCRYCGFTVTAPSICPSCNSGYLYYAGAGTEKAESELARSFPQARIRRSETIAANDLEQADIIVASESGIRHAQAWFSLVGVLAVDTMLNAIDLRAAERTLSVLTRLRTLSRGRMIVQTNLSGHHCFSALSRGDQRLFYQPEYRQRKQLDFPPCRHFIEIRLRGPREERVKTVAGTVAGQFRDKAGRTFKMVAAGPGHPLKVRSQFNWSVLLSVRDPEAASPRVKNLLKEVRHSGIIMTVDIDPV